MTTLILALILGVPPNAYYSGDDLPSVPASAYFSGSAAEDPDVKLPVVFFYTVPNCPACDTGKMELAKLSTFRVEVKSPPAWTNGKTFPILHWETQHGWKYQEGWSGTSHFLAAFTSSQKQVTKPSVVATRYPIRGSWWTGCSDWRHLTQGEHAGKFDHNWLRSLSNSEVQSLHSDDHENRVKWQYVVRGSGTSSSQSQDVQAEDQRYYKKSGKPRSSLGVWLRGG